MKISLKWIHEFVDVQEYFLKPEVLADILTKAGLEVEDIQNKSKDYSNVVTGLILEKDKHPNADKLSLCKVMTSAGTVHQIVCGAQNHKKDDKVVVALPGAVLPTPGNSDGFAIKQSVIRGVDSGGMLCSLKELGLAKESDGIEILPESAPIGIGFAEYMGLDDVTMELKVTPNRADCLSHYGLAREISALTGRPLKKKMLESEIHIKNENRSEQSTRERIQVEVKNSELCPRYCGRWIEGVKVGPSPVWLKQRLELLGMNSINNIVDVTNYVMLELGQPLHAFDGSEIRSGKVVVGKTKPNSEVNSEEDAGIEGLGLQTKTAAVADGDEASFITLDGTVLRLTGEELMIQDDVRPMCMAGTIGGKNSGVSELTQNIFLESAFFTPASVRKNLRTHGLNTDSGYRFSRGVDPSQTRIGLERATELIVQVAGGKAYTGIYDILAGTLDPVIVDVHLQTVTDRLGYAADLNKMKDFFIRLGCLVESLPESGANSFNGGTNSSSSGGSVGSDTSKNLRVTAPSYRFDLENEMDFVEEYARMNGYEHIPEAIPALSEAPRAQDMMFVNQSLAAEVLSSQGWSEARNFAFTSEKQEQEFLGELDKLKNLNLTLANTSIKLINPLNEDLNRMRISLGAGLFKNVVYNFHQGNLWGRLFEIGECFALKESQFHQQWNMGLAAWGSPMGLWSSTDELGAAKKNQLVAPLVYELKATMDIFLQKMKIKGYQWQAVVDRSQVPSYIHRGQCLFLKVAGQTVGFIGAMHPVLCDQEKLRVSVVVGEFNFEMLVKTKSNAVKIKTPSKMPKMIRDLALLMPKSLRSAEVEKEIRTLAGTELVGLQVFDVFEPSAEMSGGLEKGQKSVAYRLVFQSEKGTLQESEVQTKIDGVLKNLETKFQIRVR